MNAVFDFIAGSVGRLIRALAGLALILIGLLLVKGVGGWILAIVGLAPLAAGIFDFCIFAPLFSLPFMGPRLREKLEQEHE
jgi:sorbitol-specific phosphotransferase system component IIBC